MLYYLLLLLKVLLYFNFCIIFVKSILPPTPSPSHVRSSLNNIDTIAGTGIASSTGTGGVATAMTLNSPRGVWEDSLGVIYFAEYGHCVRKFSYPNGIVVNVAGVCGSSGSYSGDNGLATSALFNQPSGITVDSLGVIYIADVANFLVRKVSNLIVTSISGTRTSTNTGDGGPASSATITPYALWIDSLNQLFVASKENYIRKITTGSSMIITLIAGNYCI